MTHYDAMADYRQARARAERLATAVEALTTAADALDYDARDDDFYNELDAVVEKLTERLRLADHSVSLHALNIMAEAA